MQKFQVGDYARIGGPTGRMPGDYPWLRKGRLVRIAAVIINQNYLGRRHIGYLVKGRRGRPDAVLSSYELRLPEERDSRGRKAKQGIRTTTAP